MRYALSLPILFVACIAAAPATRPTTVPAASPADAARYASDEYKAANAAFQDASKGAIEALASNAAYKAAVKKRDSAKSALDVARKDGSTSAKMEASSAYNKARMIVEKMESEAVNADVAVKNSRDVLVSAKSKLEKAYAAERVAAAEKAAAAEAAKPKPPKQYKKGDELETGMTIEQVQQAIGDAGAKDAETESTVHYIFAIVEFIPDSNSQVTRWYCTFDKVNKKLISYTKR